jgi:hypothetical protein
MNARHDASYKHLFSSPKVVQHLIEGFLLDKGLEGLGRLDFTTLEKVPASYVSDDLRQRADDAIWRIKTDKDRPPIGTVSLNPERELQVTIAEPEKQVA